MPALDALLNAAQAKTAQKTDSAVAVALGVTRSAVSMWRSGGVITEKHLTALVAFSGADPAMAVDVLAEQAQTKAQRDVWGALARHLGTAAVVASVVLLLSGPAQAAQVKPSADFRSLPIMSITD